MARMSPEAAARLLHNTYEQMAPEFGYTTRTDTRVFDPDSPNGRLMVAVCAVLLRTLDGVDEPAPGWAPPPPHSAWAHGESVTLAGTTWAWDPARRQWCAAGTVCPMCCTSPCRCAAVFTAPGTQPAP